MGVIYRIVNVVNDNLYIGSAVNPRRRRWEHWSSLKKGTHHCSALQAAWNEYGEDAFEFEIVQEVPDDKDLLLIEDTYLLQHAGRQHCYNTAVSTQQSSAALPEVREKISSSLKEKYRSGEFVPRLGKRHGDETRALISKKVRRAVAQGRGGKFIPSEETRKKMSDALKGNQCAKGYKRTEAEREAIRQRVLGNQNWLGKHHTEASKAKMSKRVIELTTNTEFPSLTAVLEQYGLKMPTLRRALKSDKPISKGPNAGLHFRYLESP
jgi:group I intron endonuclease